MHAPQQFEHGCSFLWVAVKELKLSYHTSDTIVFTIYPYSGSLNSVPYQHPSFIPFDSPSGWACA